MSTATVSRIIPVQSELLSELRAELSHVRDLVLVRDLLRERGATSFELREYDAVIDAAHARLAESSKRASVRYATAA